MIEYPENAPLPSPLEAWKLTNHLGEDDPIYRLLTIHNRALYVGMREEDGEWEAHTFIQELSGLGGGQHTTGDTTKLYETARNFMQSQANTLQRKITYNFESNIHNMIEWADKQGSQVFKWNGGITHVGPVRVYSAVKEFLPQPPTP